MINQEELELRNALAHHGILGQKWGVRRFQNKAGELTSAGKQKIKQLHEKEMNEGKYRSPIKETGYGVARQIGVALGSGTIKALSTVVLSTGHAQAALVINTIGDTAYRAGTIANAAYTGKNIAYSLLSK